MAETASCVIHLAAKVPPFDGISNFFPLVEAMISDKDVSDHHAIIPTMEIEKADIKALPLGERNLFLLVCCKLLCASTEPYVYETVTATFDCCGHSFTAKGKRILSEGWREIDRIFRAFLKEKPADTRFVFGYAHDKEIYSLEVEGQKPDGVIEINVYDRTMYLWYYDDLKSDKRGNNLSYSVDVPE